MIMESIKQLIGSVSHVFVATADSSGHPHIAIGEQVIVSENSVLIFKNWFCPVTLQNISNNSKVSVVVVMPGTGIGYQMLGSVVWSADAEFIDRYDPSMYLPETPQILTRFNVKVEQVLEFTSGIHSDIHLVAEHATSIADATLFADAG